MTSIFFPGKLREFTRTFMSTGGSSSDVSNDVFFGQEDKDCYQVKMWPRTQQLFIKSIVPNFVELSSWLAVVAVCLTAFYDRLVLTRKCTSVRCSN